MLEFGTTVTPYHTYNTQQYKLTLRISFSKFYTLLEKVLHQKPADQDQHFLPNGETISIMIYKTELNS